MDYRTEPNPGVENDAWVKDRRCRGRLRTTGRPKENFETGGRREDESGGPSLLQGWSGGREDEPINGPVLTSSDSESICRVTNWRGMFLRSGVVCVGLGRRRRRDGRVRHLLGHPRTGSSRLNPVLIPGHENRSSPVLTYRFLSRDSEVVHSLRCFVNQKPPTLLNCGNFHFSWVEIFTKVYTQ